MAVSSAAVEHCTLLYTTKPVSIWPPNLFNKFFALCRAIQEYESQGIPITFLSGGNEVEVGVFSVLWNLNRYENWLTNKLCPIVKDKVKLLALDDQTIFLPNWMKVMNGIQHRKIGFLCT